MVVWGSPPTKLASPPWHKKKLNPISQCKGNDEAVLEYISATQDTMSEPTKKRKRNADGSKKSSKKVAVETPGASEVTVTVVQNTDDWAPIVGM